MYGLAINEYNAKSVADFSHVLHVCARQDHVQGRSLMEKGMNWVSEFPTASRLMKSVSVKITVSLLTG